MHDYEEELAQMREESKELASKIIMEEKAVDIDIDIQEIDEIELIPIDSDKLDAIGRLLQASIGRNIIVYDKREERSGRPQMLKSAFVAFGTECKFVDVVLPIGDYIVNGACIEYKTEEDFIQSKINGHLDTQLFNMSARYDMSYLFVEGDIFAAGDGRVHYNALLSSFLGASFKKSSHGQHGVINLVPLQDSGSFPYAVKFLMQKEHIRYPPPMKVPVSRSEMAVATLSTIPSVGTTRARNLIKHFHSLRAVFDASVEELMEVKDVGKTTAEAIIQYIEERFKPKEKHIL